MLGILDGGVLPKDVMYHLVAFARSKTIIMRLRTAQYFEVILKQSNKKSKMRGYFKQSGGSPISLDGAGFVARHQLVFEYFLIVAAEDLN